LYIKNNILMKCYWKISIMMKIKRAINLKELFNAVYLNKK